MTDAPDLFDALDALYAAMKELEHKGGIDKKEWGAGIIAARNILDKIEQKTKEFNKEMV